MVFCTKSADPKLIWGYCLDRFSPDENTVLAQDSDARKYTLTFFFFFSYSLFFEFMHGCLQIHELHHNGRVELDSSYFPPFSY